MAQYLPTGEHRAEQTAPSSSWNGLVYSRPASANSHVEYTEYKNSEHAFRVDGQRLFLKSVTNIDVKGAPHRYQSFACRQLKQLAS